MIQIISSEIWKGGEWYSSSITLAVLIFGRDFLHDLILPVIFSEKQYIETLTDQIPRKNLSGNKTFRLVNFSYWPSLDMCNCFTLTIIESCIPWHHCNAKHHNGHPSKINECVCIWWRHPVTWHESITAAAANLWRNTCGKYRTIHGHICTWRLASWEFLSRGWKAGVCDIPL